MARTSVVKLRRNGRTVKRTIISCGLLFSKNFFATTFLLNKKMGYFFNLTLFIDFLFKENFSSIWSTHRNILCYIKMFRGIFLPVLTVRLRKSSDFQNSFRGSCEKKKVRETLSLIVFTQAQH